MGKRHIATQILQHARLLRRARRRRKALAAFACLVLLASWGVKHSGLFTLLTFDQTALEKEQLDVWVTPPGPLHAAPQILSVSSQTQEPIVLAQGSVIAAHISGDNGAPSLEVDGSGKDFAADPQGGYETSQTLTGGHELSIRRGWTTLASWKIRVVADKPPQAAITAPPALTEDKGVRIAYAASDDFGIAEVALRLTPLAPPPGANPAPVEISLVSPHDKSVERADVERLSSHPWAGQKVSMQIVATSITGKQSQSEAVEFTLPERAFFHPIARVLIEIRKKLLQDPDNETLREEAANIMAGIAHRPANFHGDPAVLMALRAGAVRMVLNGNHEAVQAINDLLWQAATRIEDGNPPKSSRALRDSSRDIAQTETTRQSAVKRS